MTRILTMAMLTAWCAAAAAAQEPTLRPIATVRELMEAMIIPASDALFDVPPEAPTDDAEWKRLRYNALILAESANLLLIGDRPRDREVWVRSARTLGDAALDALKAVDGRNIDALLDAGDRILGACTQCHDRHLPSGQRY